MSDLDKAKLIANHLANGLIGEIPDSASEALRVLLTAYEDREADTNRMGWLRLNVCAITTRDADGEEFTYDTDGDSHIAEVVDELMAPELVHQPGCLADDPDGCNCAALSGTENTTP